MDKAKILMIMRKKIQLNHISALNNVSLWHERNIANKIKPFDSVKFDLNQRASYQLFQFTCIVRF